MCEQREWSRVGWRVPGGREATQRGSSDQDVGARSTGGGVQKRGMYRDKQARGRENYISWIDMYDGWGWEGTLAHKCQVQQELGTGFGNEEARRR